MDNGDNPFLCVEPGTSFGYLIRVPPDHPAVTFWYHSHHHGMVANRIASFSHHRGGARSKSDHDQLQELPKTTTETPPPRTHLAGPVHATRRARRPVARA
jgi:hypothetical protein